MRDIINAIRRKDYHTATEGIFESLNTKAEARLLAERRQLHEADMLDIVLKRGFDLSTKSGGKVSVRCSQCEALVISGVPAHERGCPNATSTCRGCDRTVPARQQYCSDCS